MKIVHIISSLHTGGAASTLVRLILNMPQHNHVVITLTDIGHLGESLIECGYTVHEVRLKNSTLWSALPRLWRLVRKERPEIVQTWMYHSDLIGGVISRLAGVRHIIWNVRNTHIPQGRFSKTGLFVKLCAITSSWLPSAIICCAKSSMEFHVMKGYQRKKMTMIPNGYEALNWHPIGADRAKARRNYGFPDCAFIVGIVGRYDMLKGYDVFIEAAAIISKSINNAIFIMIGRHVNEDNFELNSLILTRGGNADFRLLDERRDVMKIISTMDVYCLSSISEGFPNVVAEAMLMQIPCVVANVGDAAQIVGPTGYVVPPRNPSAIAEAVCALANIGEKQRRAFGKAARQRIVDNYSIEAVSKEYDKLYSEIVNQKVWSFRDLCG